MRYLSLRRILIFKRNGKKDLTKRPLTMILYSEYREELVEKKVAATVEAAAIDRKRNQNMITMVHECGIYRIVHVCGDSSYREVNIRILNRLHSHNNTHTAHTYTHE